MKLIWKFNLVLLGIFALGFVVAGYISYRALQANAREEILQNARLMMEVGAVDAQLHGRAGQAAARYADALQVPAADGARVRRDRAVQRAAQEASRTTRTRRRRSIPTNPRDRAADWEADVVNVFRATSTTTEIVGERDTPTGPHAVPVAADPDQERRLPRVPQHGRRRAEDHDRPVRPRQRLRLEDGRGHRRADRVGADGGADRAREQDVHRVHGLARRGVRRDLRAAQRHALHDGDPAGDARSRASPTR